MHLIEGMVVVVETNRLTDSMSWAVAAVSAAGKKIQCQRQPQVLLGALTGHGKDKVC